MQRRRIKQIFQRRPIIEGAGVELSRVFGFGEVPLFDPFLLLDDLRSQDRNAYSPGFPWHPHRGIESITYVLRGQVEHRDSLGYSEVVGAGDLQWITSGSGVIHEEMPAGVEDDAISSLQMWVNLPATDKMIDPHYQRRGGEQLPKLKLPGGGSARVICGKLAGERGLVRQWGTEVECYDVELPPGSELLHPTQLGFTVFAYMVEGKACFGRRTDMVPPAVRDSFLNLKEEAVVEYGSVVLLSDGDELVVSTQESQARFLLVSGRPIGESVAWYGPIVMNRPEQLSRAFEEYANGVFIKKKATVSSAS